jgi:HAD superfamily hydrolase (TIGR01509 family)
VTQRFARLDLADVRVVLCDADGTLFGSEEPAFDASVRVTNALMEELGSSTRFTARELRLSTNGRNFRSTAPRLAEAEGLTLSEEALERWVAIERRAVREHLEQTLTPDVSVRAPVRRLGERYELAVVTSSAASRVAACLRVSALADLFAPDRLFSAEDSLRPPQSKPSPAIYEHAGEELGVAGGEAVAVEDAIPGVESAVAAGFPVIGLLAFVPADEREARRAALVDAGATFVAETWADVESLLAPARHPTGVAG